MRMPFMVIPVSLPPYIMLPADGAGKVIGDVA